MLANLRPNKCKNKQMAKAKDISKYEEKLEELKTEEKFIRTILEDVRKQLDRYEVERMHLSGLEFESQSDDGTENLMIDEESKEDQLNLDSETDINKKPVHLEINKREFFYKNSDDDEEFDEDV